MGYDADVDADADPDADADDDADDDGDDDDDALTFSSSSLKSSRVVTKQAAKSAVSMEAKQDTTSTAVPSTQGNGTNEL